MRRRVCVCLQQTMAYVCLQEKNKTKSNSIEFGFIIFENYQTPFIIFCFFPFALMWMQGCLTTTTNP